MDAFWGQRRKLKNRWSDDLWKVVWQVADDVQAYVVWSTKTGKAKVLHRAWLLLWLADYTQDGLEVNVLRLEDDTPPSTTLEALPIREKEGGTPLELTYGLNLAMFGYSLDTSMPMMDPKVQEMPMGTSQNETSLETMDVDVKEERVTDDEQKSGDIPYSPTIWVAMEF